MSVLVEYLEGNAAHSIGSECKEWPTAITANGDCVIGILWGRQFSSSYHIANFSRVAPVGPIRITTHVEGFTSDTVTFNGETGWRYYWYPLYESDPRSPNPAAEIEAIEIHNYPDLFSTAQLSVLDWPQLYLGAHAVDPPGNPFDANLDGIHDTADLIFAMPKSEEEENRAR